VSIRLYVEGGGDSKALRARCRRGFSEFIRKAGLGGRMPRIVASGGRRAAYDRFRTACEHRANGGAPMLLIDAEGPVTSFDVWEHLSSCDGWQRPQGTRDNQGHLMIECMESWFLADRNAVETYFGPGFRGGALPRIVNIENVPRADVLEGLDRAARATKKKWSCDGWLPRRRKRPDRRVLRP
jgi:hypothetical protein